MVHRQRIWLILALLLAAIIVPFLVWGHTFESLLSPDAMRELFVQNRRIAWMIGILLLIADLFLPIPSTIVMSSLGWLYGPVIGGLISSVGLLLSALMAYQLSRFFGRRLAVRLAGEGSLTAAAQWFSQAGSPCIAVSRCLPVLNEAVACLAGLSGFPLRRFLAASLAGSVPSGFTFAYIGHLGSKNSTAAIALSVIIPVVLWFLYRKVSHLNTRPKS